MRLIHGESDGLPGLIVDQYGDVLVMQIGSAGAERWRDICADILQELCEPICIYERSDSDSRALEGLPERNGILRGALPHEIFIAENGLTFAIDVAHGQKTGFYLDQRDNRALTDTLARNKEVLNCFCYTGGFSLYALRSGAKSVLSIDASEEALQLAQRNLALNGLDASRAEWQCADVFAALRKLRDQNKKFDLIILDPPKFAPTAAFAEKAARGYKDINLLGLKLLRPGGLLFTYSCSGGISDDLFQKIVAGAALDAGVTAHIVRKLHAAADHPVLLSFPEGAYLKGLVERAHDVRPHRHQHHHHHDGHSDDAVDDSAPEQGLNRIDGGEIERDSEDGRYDHDRVKPSRLQELKAEPYTPVECLGNGVGCRAARIGTASSPVPTMPAENSANAKSPARGAAPAPPARKSECQ